MNPGGIARLLAQAPGEPIPWDRWGFLGFVVVATIYLWRDIVIPFRDRVFAKNDAFLAEQAAKIAGLVEVADKMVAQNERIIELLEGLPEEICTRLQPQLTARGRGPTMLHRPPRPPDAASGAGPTSSPSA